jgi:membrane protein DedA with SNARE-associated domain
MVIHGLRHFLIIYGYFLAVPVMIVEGPIATMAMAALASLGYFNIGIVFLLGITADLISDYLYYQIGYRGGQRIILRISKTLRFDMERMEGFKQQFQNHGAKAVFLAKLLPGVVPPVFIAAGLTRYPLRKLYKYALPAGIIWTTALTLVGYYFGKNLRSIEALLSKTGIVLALVVILFILYQYTFGKTIARRAFRSKNSPGLGIKDK